MLYFLAAVVFDLAQGITCNVTLLGHEGVDPPQLPEHLPSGGPQPDCLWEGESVTKLFIWLCWVLTAVCKIVDLLCSMPDLQLQHSNS